MKKMKKSFIQKFFPNCENSPSGSEKLAPAVGTNSTKVEGVGKLMKVRSESYLECSATSPIRKLNNTPNNAILKKTSSRLSYLVVGQSELFAVSESTNHKPGPVTRRRRV